MPVRLIKCVGYLAANFQRLIDWERALDQTLCQRFTFHVLHHQVVDTVLGAHVMKRADVGMIESRYGFSFALEALLPHWVIRKMRRQDLYSYRAVESRVLCPIDLPHSACTNRRDDFVWT